jgi:hypothetical protein
MTIKKTKQTVGLRQFDFRIMSDERCDFCDNVTKEEFNCSFVSIHKSKTLLNACNEL